MKGQWFIISAVIASSIFLGMSFLLKDYFAVDTAAVGRVNSDFYFGNIENQLDNIVRNSVTSVANCLNLTTSLDEFIALAERDLASRGYYAKIEYKVVQCSPNVVNFDFIVASHDSIVHNFTKRENVSELIG
ncbi:MAG: hypothetical protein HY517_00070 [Candidatus Aenigmarchaeota archaeon]|nr:hypothetical protein [Candidatus Aenigmarchaeota archaeon]